MKYEWRKLEKEYYLPKTIPTLVTIPKSKYICIDGKGNPNEPNFESHIEALYQISYAIKMMPKKGIIPSGYFDYTVYPLEGIWDINQCNNQNKPWKKEDFIYTIMIKQPSFVDQKVFEQAFFIASQKSKNPYLKEVYIKDMEDGLSVQILHLGSYDTELQSFHKLDQFMKESKLKRTTMIHKEIYLSNPKKGKEDNQKTVLRYFVCKEEN